MRRISGSLFQSLDGVIQAPGGPEEDQTDFAHGGWVFPYFDGSLDEPMGVHFASYALGGEVTTGTFATKPPSEDELALRRRQAEGI